MDDIVFVEPDAEEPSADEVLDVGSPRTLSRRFGVLALVVVAAAGIAAAVINEDDPKAPAALTRTASPSTSSSPAPGQDLISGTPKPVDALIPAPGRLGFYGLSNERLVAFDLNGARRATSAPVRSVPTDGPEVTLAFDAVNSLVWVIPVGDDVVGTLEAYDASNLRLAVRLQLPDVVDHAAALDGQLYLMTRSGRLLRTQPDGRSLETVTRMSDSVGAMAADPQRHRLLLLIYDRHVLLRSWVPSGAPAVSAHLPFGKGDVAVVDGTIWVGGFGKHGAVLAKADPRTLRGARSVPVAAQLGPGALLAGSGEGILFVRSGGQDAPLWCLNAANGVVEERWSGLPGIVASTSGAGLIAAPFEDVRPLEMTSCGR
jgi:hypothetical protein